jgi:hypothetical protein
MILHLMKIKLFIHGKMYMRLTFLGFSITSHCFLESRTHNIDIAHSGEVSYATSNRYKSDMVMSCHS